MMQCNESFQLRKLQQNPDRHAAILSIPSQYVKAMKLSANQVMKISMIQDENDSRLVISPARIN